ncbi:MAG: regulatory protein RecX [Catalinimonas sp.]
MIPPKKRHDPAVAYAKAAKFCAYQERSRREVLDKLRDLGLTPDESATVLERLESENFVNEERFVSAYVGGKFRMKRWGRTKIRQGLRAHGVSDAAVRAGLGELSDDDYRAALDKLATQKAATLSPDLEPLKRKQKLVTYLMGRGYESDLIWPTVERILSDA